ncbi:MAG: hypothetical protein BMS9Abin10_1013 [Gammaproteobacteria bacterium]|nr:MAG: hypothetical protein BMS9Abin10_1013 [Gammaproteobacteria bacterium]
MARQLDTVTLDKAARHYAAQWMQPDLRSPSGKVFVGGPSYVLQDFNNFTFKDEFEHLLAGIKGWLGPKGLADFEAKSKEQLTPRDTKVFHDLLAEHLAVDPQGRHIAGAIGKTQIGNRIVGKRQVFFRTKRHEHLLIKNVYWPIYAGEEEERAAGSKAVTPLPRADLPPAPAGGMALVPNISAALAIKLADLIDDEFNIGSTAAEIRGRTGAQPVDPDAVESGTLLFTLPMAATAFAAAADAAPGGVITAAAITDDSSADATGTLGYCRSAATGTGADDVVDGEAGTSGADFNFNTLAIVSGATISMTSFTITVPQGSTAT